jgi:hypothetical protein
MEYCLLSRGFPLVSSCGLSVFVVNGVKLHLTLAADSSVTSYHQGNSAAASEPIALLTAATSLKVAAHYCYLFGLDLRSCLFQLCKNAIRGLEEFTAWKCE